MCQPPGGAEGPEALPPQQCEAWIENLTAQIRRYRTKSLKNPNFKSFTRFFSCEGCPPPVCLRCSPGLFRHGGGAASCHTSSMAAKPHLALTKNSSPTTLANGRRATQIAGSRGQRPRSPVATGEIPAPRKARNTRPPQRAKLPYRTDYSTMPMQPWTARNSSRPVTTGAALEDFPAARRSAAMAYRTVSTVKDTAPVTANLTSSIPPRSPAK